MDIEQLIITIIQIFNSILILISVSLIYKTIKSNEKSNKRIIFNELVKQERELRIKLNEYRKEIHKKRAESKDFIEIAQEYDTLLFNYYEYLAISIYEKSVTEKETKLFFRGLMKDVKELFEKSSLFDEKSYSDYSKKEDYKALQWLFRRWNI
tara:strand:+ start:4754 stop:5212 length:459 start_codon:yes stop_codon:yes gene_type:complete